MLDDKAIKKVDVRISEAAKVQILVYRFRLLCHLLETPFHLDFLVLDAWREQSMSSVVPADSCGMGSVIVTAVWSLIYC